jgi:hydrogenase maturation protease
MAPRRVTILVCGEPMRGDDALALEAVRALDPTTREAAEIREVGQLSPDELLDAPEPVIVVDAVSGPPPGELVDLTLGDLAAAGGPTPRASSSHALPLATAVSLSVRLRGAPPEGRFLGLAGADYGLDAPLSATIRAALPRLTARIVACVAELAAAEPPEQGRS